MGTTLEIVNKSPLINVDEQINYLQNKGVKFNIFSTDDAKKYLGNNINLFRLKIYQSYFPTHPDGQNKGKFIDLEFAFLKDLSVIDMRLRYVFLHMSLDIEYYAKLKLIKALQDFGDNGYDMVSRYISYLEHVSDNKTLSEISRNRESNYFKKICSEYYENNYPVWIFVEMISFGTFIGFYKYCYECIGDKELRKDVYSLINVKNLRNACAHNNCILYDLRDKGDMNINHDISNILGRNGISKTTRQSKLSNDRMKQIVTLLYCHYSMVTSEGVRKNQILMLYKAIDRMFKHIDYYSTNELIRTNFEFLKKVVDIFSRDEYNI